MEKICAMFGRSQVKIPFGVRKLVIVLHNNNMDINTYASHLRKHCITFHSSSIQHLLSLLTAQGAEQLRLKVEGLTSNSKVSQ